MVGDRVGAGSDASRDSGSDSTSDVGSSPVPNAATSHAFPRRMVLANLAVLLVGLTLQLLVYGNGGHTSLSDLPHVFLHRGVGPGALPYVDRVLEYPVGSGILLYLASLVSPTPLGVLVTTSIAAIALSLWITVELERSYGPRAWRWALGTPVLLFAFQNWDMFAIATVIGALALFAKRRSAGAGALIGVGTAVKLFPIVLLPILFAHRWATGDRRAARRLAGSGAIVWLAFNLPFAIANPRGWWWPTSFQGDRQATWGSVWFWLYRWVGAPVHGAAGSEFANLAAMVLLALGVGALTWWTARGRIAPVPAAMAAVAWFLVSNKVYSPTYDLWLVAFFVLLPIRRRIWVAFCAVDLAVYVTVFGMFHGLWDRSVVRDVLPYLVFTRAIVILALVGHVVARSRAEADDPLTFDARDGGSAPRRSRTSLGGAATG